MDFLSKLLKGDKSVQKAAKGFLNNLMADTPSQPAQKPAQQASIFSSKRQSGFSWGDVRPEDENQSNFNGSFMEYFEGIFRAEMPEYRVTRSMPGTSKCVVYTFFSGGSTVLVVELMSDACYAKKVRSECEKYRIPYLRFYYDHPGWWNTRAYVVQRLRNALGR